MRCAVVPASLLAKPPPPPFRRHAKTPRTFTTWSAEDWCGNDAAVVQARKRVQRAERGLANARADLEAAERQHAEAEAAAAALGYTIIKRD